MDWCCILLITLFFQMYGLVLHKRTGSKKNTFFQSQYSHISSQLTIVKVKSCLSISTMPCISPHQQTLNSWVKLGYVAKVKITNLMWFCGCLRRLPPHDFCRQPGFDNSPSGSKYETWTLAQFPLCKLGNCFAFDALLSITWPQTTHGESSNFGRSFIFCFDIYVFLLCGSAEHNRARLVRRHKKELSTQGDHCQRL